jgi:hypothetical protein
MGVDMAITGMFFKFGRSDGGDNGHLASMHIGFGPHHAVAMTALTETLGDGNGMQQIFIDGFSIRKPGHTLDTPIPTKGEDDSPYFNPPVVSDEHMTGVTAQLWAGPDQAVGGTLTVWFFG